VSAPHPAATQVSASLPNFQQVTRGEAERLLASGEFSYVFRPSSGGGFALSFYRDGYFTHTSVEPHSGKWLAGGKFYATPASMVAALHSNSVGHLESTPSSRQVSSNSFIVEVIRCNVLLLGGGGTCGLYEIDHL